MSRLKRGFSMLSAFTFGLSLLGGVLVGGLKVKANTPNISNPRIADDGMVTWDKVEFGSYYQDVTFEKEPIKWRILSVNEDGTDAFLMSDKALDCMPYNEEYDADNVIYSIDYSCTWENSTLRRWLNDDKNGFMKQAFTQEEQKLIKSVNVDNTTNLPKGAPKENDTVDKVYLLSLSEIGNSDYGFEPLENLELAISGADDARIIQATDYAEYKGAECYNNKNAGWWLRTSGDHENNASFVMSYGALHYFAAGAEDQGFVYDEDIAVCPVLHVDLNASCVLDAGKVGSDGTVIETSDEGYESDGYVNPKVESGITTWDCVYFGNYKKSISSDKTPIEWRVLSVDGDDAFLLADKALDCRRFNSKGVTTYESGGVLIDFSCTWGKSSIRKWLNDENNGFICNAFSIDEKAAIKSSTVKNDDTVTEQFTTDCGNDTVDKVFLLSLAEATEKKYGFTNRYTSEIRQSVATEFAKDNGTYTDENGKCNWWLRSNGVSNVCAACVDADGRLYEHGRQVTDTTVAVRPALRVSLSKADLKTVGTVTSQGEYLGETDKAKIDEVKKLIDEIGVVDVSKKGKISTAREAYDSLNDDLKIYVSNYTVLQEAEEQLKKLENATSTSDNSNAGSSNNLSNSDNYTTDSNNTGNNNAVNNNSNQTDENANAVTETPKDNLTTFNIKNKKTYKKSKKVTIKDEDGIKSVVLNSKKIKFKSGKKTVSFKLSSYKKSLKKKNKWNKIMVTDVNGNKKTIQFKVK